MFFLQIVFCCLTAVIVARAEQTCVSSSLPDFRPDPDDCSLFYVCSGGKLFRFKCPSSVYDPVTSTCVLKGSIYDTCPTKETRIGAKTCLPYGPALIPHPKHCAQFYNCSASAPHVKWEDHLQECLHPSVFNSITQRCEHYSLVQCGSRTVPLSQCDYRRHQCESANCIPCNVRYPDCRGLPDGLAPWIGRQDSPYFVVCESNRVVYTGTCSQELGPQIFHPIKKLCIEYNP